MNKTLQAEFQEKWGKYFGTARLPVCWFYSDTPDKSDLEESKNVNRCLIGNLNQVFDGQTFVYHKSSPGCLGGKRYTGYSQKLRSGFRYFLSCGIEGQTEGERYKKSPELVDEILKQQKPFQAPADYLIFKRWDKIQEDENPEVVVFLNPPDVIAGLFTLANFDLSDPEGVITPFGSGCASIIDYPLRQTKKNNPKSVLGMFDISARPNVPGDSFTFSVPFNRFKEMAANMDESFLITDSWRKVKRRI